MPGSDTWRSLSGGRTAGALLNGEDVSGLVKYTEEVGNMASAVSGYMPVRES